MAEAAVDHRPNKFFCHQCSVEISPNLPDFTCPRCQSGFIEEVENTDDMLNDDSHGSGEMDPAQQFAELWGRTFLERFRMHTDPDNISPDEESPSGSSHGDTSQEDGPYHQQIYPGTQLHVRRIGHPVGHHHPPSIEGIIQQILGGLTGATVIRSGGLPGNMFSLYGNPGDYAWGAGGLDAIITQLLNQLESSGAPPAEKSEIENLPSVEITQEQIDNKLQCSVCMEDFKLKEVVRQLVCQHCYHTDCIVPWLELHGTCPVCRKNLKGEDPSTNGSSDDGAPGTQNYVDSSTLYDFSTQGEQD